jgi:hypothetical protein
MRVLLANLKHFHQHRVLMLVIVFYLLLGLCLLAQAKEEVALAFLIILDFAVGVTIAVMQMEIVSKAFSFCLPDHRTLVRKLIFLIGLAVSLAFPLLLSRRFAQAGMTAGRSALLWSAAYSAGMIVYLIGAVLGLCVRIPALILFLAPWIAFGGILSGLHVRIESAIVDAPVPMIAAAMASGAVFWLWLSRSTWSRDRCTRLWIGFSGLSDPSKIDQCGPVLAWVRPKTRACPLVDGFFRSMMTRHGRCERLTCVWGAVYGTVLWNFWLWRQKVAKLLMVLLLAGYIPPLVPFIAGLALPMMILSFPASLYLKSFVADGRREKFIVLIVILTGLTSMAVLIFVSLAALSNVVALLTPEVRVSDLTFRYRAIGLKAVWYLIIVCPIVGVVHILSCTIQPVLLGVLAASLALSLMVYFMHFAATPSLYVIGGVTLSWIICFLIVYSITMRNDLGRR